MQCSHRFRLVRLLACAVTLFQLSAWVAAAPKAYVGNFKDNTVSVIDLASGQTKQSIAVGNGPRKIAVH